MPKPATPRYSPGPAELDDLELLAAGALPVPAESDRPDSGHPAGGQPGFGEPATGVTLHLPRDLAEQAAAAGAIELSDPEGAPVATVAVERLYDAGPDLAGVVGAVRAVHGRVDRPFGRLHLGPAELHRDVSAPTLLVCDRPPGTADLERARRQSADRPVVLVALTGHGTPHGVSPDGLVRACVAAAGQLDGASVVAVPLARREDPDLDRAVRDRVLAAYAGPQGTTVVATGAEPLPPAVAQVVARDRPTGLSRGLALFFTGLSGSGKSTIARGVRNALAERGERTVTLLDGDVVRRHLSAGLTFSPADRDLNIRRIGWVAAEIARHGGTAVCSPIAPFDRTRRDVRAMVTDAGGAFVLVHVATPLAECERRDRKGLYAKARRGEIPDFTGISSPYEPPEDADLRLDTTGRPVAEMVGAVLTLLHERELVSEPAATLDPISPAAARPAQG